MLILAVVLTYRICDAIWGTFAYPFYLGELEYTNDDVAFASKFFGVGAIIAGLALGGIGQRFRNRAEAGAAKRQGRIACWQRIHLRAGVSLAERFGGLKAARAAS